MHLNSSIVAALLTTMAGADSIRFIPNAGNDCNGDGLPSDSTNGLSNHINACFDISGASSFQWHYFSKSATSSDWAKFTYYSETDCNGDVTAVKGLCGDGTGDGTCYNKHDANAGSVRVQNQITDCSFWDEGELECPGPNDGGSILDPTCPQFPI